MAQLASAALLGVRSTGFHLLQCHYLAAPAGTVSCRSDPDFVPSLLPELWQSRGAAWVEQQEQQQQQQQLSGGHLTVLQSSVGSVQSRRERSVTAASSAGAAAADWDWAAVSQPERWVSAVISCNLKLCLAGVCLSLHINDGLQCM
jgi:hypothetical protein